MICPMVAAADIIPDVSFRFANGGDEMAMNAEIGLYLQFDVTNGIPKNCPGLQKFTLKKYLKSNFVII